MQKKRMIIIGLVGVLIGLILIVTFGEKMQEANAFLDMGRDFNFGSTHMNAWSNRANDAKTGIGIGSVVIFVFGCLLLVGFCLGNKATNNCDHKERLKNLEEAKTEGLITQEEYEEKRAKILADL